MEAQLRRQPSVRIQDQENINVFKGKTNLLGIAGKGQGLTVRGALGELTNVQTQREGFGKVAVVAAEFEKKGNRNIIKSNYSHVQSKVDTGLTNRNTALPSTRPTLRREESTAGLATRATVQTKALLKENQIKIKCDSKNSFQNKKSQDMKTNKLPTVKEKNKDNKIEPKKVLKEPIESLDKLQLTESIENIDINLDVSLKLPADIEDIDAGDNNSPLLMSMYIKDIYKYLTHLELKYPIEPDHLKNQREITGKMRATLIDWLVEVHRQFSLILETFHLAVGIIDRYLQTAPNIQRSKLQLVGVTAMFVASKYEEVYPPDIRDFVFITDNAYKKADIFQCERDIISKLGFCFARPIPLSFLRRFVKAAHGTSKNHHLAKYFVDLCLVDYTMAHYRPSELAAAAICLSLHLLSSKKLEDVWTPTMSYYSTYSLEHIIPIVRKIANVVISVEGSKYKAVYKKYLDPTLAKVASLPQLKGESIYELAKS